LTQGYWLADTACTQALWKAVVGDRPSDFKGELDLPVEMVSWEDVIKKFLLVLNRQLSDAHAVLPTEAQWEYACRAGTTTTYEFGASFEFLLANVESDKTVPVKALSANRWGLYQMHGNVLEWCADAFRRYTDEVVENLDGGQDGSDRTLRGGSWINRAKRARSACRGVSPRESRNHFIGFRFALKPLKQGSGSLGWVNHASLGPRAELA
jgi:formylglycine-generating enzyme required for sulfatase activity